LGWFISTNYSKRSAAMKNRRLLMLLAAGVLAGILVVSGVQAQEATTEKSPAPQSRVAGLKITVQGKIKNMKVMGGYYLYGAGEVYKIANQNPEVLAPLSQSGESVTVEAHARGDLLTIDKLNGKKYQVKPPAAVK
jgi:hypothetical protein